MQKTAINPTRTEDFAEWYQEVIKAADLAENAPVRGCMIIKPYGYAIWENIQSIFDATLKSFDVQNVYFPLLIPIELLAKESEHIDGFAKECAVVTHHRLKKNEEGMLIPDGELASPYIVRPTSEAIIGSIVAGWIHSHRDLPMKLNQWCNVMRWEMRTRLFLRTSEFLWQEGHTIFEDNEGALQDAKRMHNEYFKFITKDLAMSAIIGEKPEEERFPGASNTYTVELMMQDGKALQAATSHNLGQSFSKAFNIKFLNKDGNNSFACTASWGITTRLIGAIIMVHSDDDGLVLPPKIAPYQVVIIPIARNTEQLNEIVSYCNKIKDLLASSNIKVCLDQSEITSSNKKWKWIKKGAPIRLEIGPNEMESKTITFFRRDLAHNDKKSIEMNNILEIIQKELHALENNLRKHMEEYTKKQTRFVDNLDEMKNLLKNNFHGFIVMEKEKTEEAKFFDLIQEYSMSRRCILNDYPSYSKNECVVIARAY
ncbi:proline--tRNA ligase [Candidatus Lariskella endosymbiont of Hedychridium roseum]|uniref:proline--tRNA ligase n=1 Tax=Candidatus Lariskella endosymbiont of Hedychridium roseum TaxID=3077949 RepID=UPI0030D5BB3E